MFFSMSLKAVQQAPGILKTSPGYQGGRWGLVTVRWIRIPKTFMSTGHEEGKSIGDPSPQIGICPPGVVKWKVW